MKFGEVSDIHLAAIVAVATLIGSASASFIEARFENVNSKASTEAEILIVAIGILKEKQGDNEFSDAQKTLRSWAGRTVNHLSPIKLSKKEVENLVSGKSAIPESAFIGTGLIGVRSHIDQPAQNPLADGIRSLVENGYIISPELGKSLVLPDKLGGETSYNGFDLIE